MVKGAVEPPLITSGDDVAQLSGFLAGRTHYSAADIGTLIEGSEKVCDFASRKSPALSIVRSGGASQVPEIVGGKGGTRTLDPGIMSAVL